MLLLDDMIWSIGWRRDNALIIVTLRWCISFFVWFLSIWTFRLSLLCKELSHSSKDIFYIAVKIAGIVIKDSFQFWGVQITTHQYSKYKMIDWICLSHVLPEQVMWWLWCEVYLKPKCDVTGAGTTCIYVHMMSFNK